MGLRTVREGGDTQGQQEGWWPDDPGVSAVDVAKSATGLTEEVLETLRRAGFDDAAASRRASNGVRARAELSPERHGEIRRSRGAVGLMMVEPAKSVVRREDRRAERRGRTVGRNNATVRDVSRVGDASAQGQRTRVR